MDAHHLNYCGRLKKVVRCGMDIRSLLQFIILFAQFGVGSFNFRRYDRNIRVFLERFVVGPISEELCETIRLFFDNGSIRAADCVAIFEEYLSNIRPQLRYAELSNVDINISTPNGYTIRRHIHSIAAHTRNEPIYVDTEGFLIAREPWRKYSLISIYVPEQNRISMFRCNNVDREGYEQLFESIRIVQDRRRVATFGAESFLSKRNHLDLQLEWGYEHGLRQAISLKDVAREFGIDVQKLCTHSDWNAEQLTVEQEQYAAMDVFALRPIYRYLFV